MTEKQRETRRKWFIALTFLAVFIVAAAIFYFSSESGEQSNATSGRFAIPLLHFFHPDYDMLSAEEQAALLGRFQIVVRKSAHFLEYAALGFSLRLFLYSIRLSPSFAFGLTLLPGAAYAGLDEYRQLLGGTRSASLWDVALDSSGVLFGLLLAILAILCHQRRKKRGVQK